MKQTSSLLVSLLLAPLSLSNGFVPVNKRLLKRPVSPSTHTLSPSILPFTSSKCRPTALHMNLLARNIPRPRVAAMIAILLLATTLLRDARNFFWPGARVDAKCEERLPEGSLGCPFIGYNIFGGTKDYGPFAKLGELSKKYGPIFKTYSFGLPIISISGMANIQSLLKHEFKNNGIGTFMIGKQNMGRIFGENMLLYENNPEKHGMLRRLVGSAMTPLAIAAGIPSIQERAEFHIDKILRKGGAAVKMEDVYQSFTLDIAWKQILGLDLNEEDIPKFHAAVEDWTKGIMNILLLLPFKVPGLEKYTKVGRASAYLKRKCEEKIAKLEREGPDSSTFSKLYFATDDGNRLSREQVIDNALLLIFAGTETSASTLACASLFMGLHPDVWEKVRAEQKDLFAKYKDLTAQALDESKYLDAVIKETLRLQPVESGEMREVKGTVVVDGKQVPKNWYALFNVKQTHYDDPSTYKEDGSHMDCRKGFKPDRWLSETTKPQQWMPFGDGRRRCIGERLGMTEMKVFLAMLARKVVKYELLNKSEGRRGIEWQTNTAMARPVNVEYTFAEA